MASANELIMIFIGLEISSIASYILAGYLRDDRAQQRIRAQIFPAGLVRHGVPALRRRLDLRHHRLDQSDRDPPRAADRQRQPLALAGTAAALMFVGFGFKISAAPFQIWAPDVYQGAPAPVSAFLSVGPKAAAFAILLRVFMTAFGPIAVAGSRSCGACALATMIVGNFAAILQSNIKRMLAL